MDIWDVFPIDEINVERNLWSKDLTDFLQRAKRPPSQVRLTDAWIARWDLVADELYGDVNFWWAVPLFNDVLDPFDEQWVHKVLLVPDVMDIVEFLRWA